MLLPVQVAYGDCKEDTLSDTGSISLLHPLIAFLSVTDRSHSLIVANTNEK